jgi:hypothetical protein
MKRPVMLTSHLQYIDKVRSYATVYQPFNKQTNDNKILDWGSIEIHFVFKLYIIYNISSSSSSSYHNT